MFSWTLGNLINAYHDIPESEGNPYVKKAANPRKRADNDLSISINKYVIVSIIIAIIGMWLYFSSWDDKIKIGGFLLVAILGHGIIFALERYTNIPQGDSVVSFDLDWSTPSIGGPDIWSISNISKELGFFVIFTFLISVIGIIIYQRYYSDEEQQKAMTRKEIMEKDFTSNIEDAIKKLKEGKDPRTTILRCYWKTCLLLEDRGVRQDEVITPREFKNLVLSNIRIDEKPLEELTNLFEEARYSSHKITEIKRDKAIRDLKNIKSKVGDRSGSGS